MNPNAALSYAALGILPWRINDPKTGLPTEKKSVPTSEKKKNRFKKDETSVKKTPRFRTSMVKA